MSDQGNERVEGQGYDVPDDALERLERLVTVLSEPLVAFTAELAAERDEARDRAQTAELLNNRLLKGLQALVREWPATSWVSLAKDEAESLLDEVGQGATMGSAEQPITQETAPHGTTPQQHPDRPPFTG